MAEAVQDDVVANCNADSEWKSDVGGQATATNDHGAGATVEDKLDTSMQPTDEGTSVWTGNPSGAGQCDAGASAWLENCRKNSDTDVQYNGLSGLDSLSEGRRTTHRRSHRFTGSFVVNAENKDRCE